MTDPTFIKADDLQKMELPEMRWSVPGLLPEGFAWLAGSPKIGKSWMALNLALAVASGGMALGSIPVAQGDVMLFALEDNKRSMRSRVQSILGDEEWPSRLTFKFELPRLDQGGQQYLDAWAQKHPEGRLIIIDTFQKIRPAATRNGVYADDYAVVGPLQKFAGDHNLTVLALTHTRKMGSDDPFQTISGTQGLTGSADSNLVLTRQRMSRDAEMVISGRELEEQKIALRWDPSTTTWTLLGDQLTEGREAIVLVLKQSAHPLTVKEISIAVGKPEQQTRRLVARMAQACQIVQRGRGLYTCIADPRDLLALVT